ncbi:MAG: glycosyltransferase family 2 protein [Flavobacteriaceae bacterium]
MKISIIIPVYNMVDFIEDTLLSIINQKRKCELIVVDGGSVDGTLEVLKKYDAYIDVLISEIDGGQYNAVNKGMRIATGDILAWINADDLYYDWTFDIVVQFFKDFPHFEWISGVSTTINAEGGMNGLMRSAIVKNRRFIRNGWYTEDIYGFLQQEGMFWRRSLMEKSGLLDEAYGLAADFDLWTRFACNADIVSVAIPLARFRIRNSSRSRALANQYMGEVEKINDTKPKFPTLIKSLMSRSLAVKMIIRKLSITSGYVYYYSASRKKWILRRKMASANHHPISSLITFR